MKPTKQTMKRTLQTNLTLAGCLLASSIWAADAGNDEGVTKEDVVHITQLQFWQHL